MAVATPHSVLFAGREYFALGGGDCAPDDVVALRAEERARRVTE